MYLLKRSLLILRLSCDVLSLPSKLLLIGCFCLLIMNHILAIFPSLIWDRKSVSWQSILSSSWNDCITILLKSISNLLHVGIFAMSTWFFLFSWLSFCSLLLSSSSLLIFAFNSFIIFNCWVVMMGDSSTTLKIFLATLRNWIYLIAFVTRCLKKRSLSLLYHFVEYTVKYYILFISWFFLYKCLWMVNMRCHFDLRDLQLFDFNRHILVQLYSQISQSWEIYLCKFLALCLYFYLSCAAKWVKCAREFFDDPRTPIYNHGYIVMIHLFNMVLIEIVQSNWTFSYCLIFNLNIIMTIFRLGNHTLYFHSTSYHVYRLRLKISTVSLLSIIVRHINTIMYHDISKHYMYLTDKFFVVENFHRYPRDVQKTSIHTNKSETLRAVLKHFYLSSQWK